MHRRGFLKALDVGEGEGIDEVDLAGAQGGQTHRVLPFGFADDLVEIGRLLPSASVSQ